MAYVLSLLLQLVSGEVIVTGFTILILIVTSLCVFVGMVSRLSKISRTPRAKPVCLFVAAFFLSSMAYHWQDYTYPFVAGLQLRSFNITLEAPRTHIQSDIADNFTVAVLSPYLKNIHKMDLVFQRTRDFTNFTFLRFPLPENCRGSILGLTCDLEREATFAVKNASDRLQHICASRYSSWITSVDPESGDIIPSLEDFYRYSNRTHRAWTLYTDVDWHVLAVMHCGGKEVTSAIQIEGKANLYGRNLFDYCTDLGIVNHVAIVFFFIATITLFGTLRRHDIEVDKVYQQMPREKSRNEETMAHSPAKQDKQDDDGISASSIADDWELVNFSTGIRHRKQNPSPIQN